MSLTLSMKSGSDDSLNVSTRCGFNPKARHIRLTVDWDIPAVFAIDRVDQWVASFGFSCSVFTMTVSRAPSGMWGGEPGGASRTSPSSRLRMNRLRHVPTVASDTPRPTATSRLVGPSAQASTIFDRRARDWGLFGRRAQRSSVSRSSSVSTSGFFGRPSLGMCTSMVTCENAPSNPKIPDQAIFLVNSRLRTLGGVEQLTAEGESMTVEERAELLRSSRGWRTSKRWTAGVSGYPVLLRGGSPYRASAGASTWVGHGSSRTPTA